MEKNFDIVIIGGGLVGMTAALACGQAGFLVAVVDRMVPTKQLGADHDGRASAIATAGFRMMTALGVAQDISGQAEPIRKIMITDGEAGKAVSPLNLFFDSAQISDDLDGEPLGHMVENQVLRTALINGLAKLGNVTWFAPAQVSGIETTAAKNIISFEDGAKISAPLLVAADGRNSFVRKQAGIETAGWDCEQSAIVTTVEHELGHDGVAHELFLPSGPFAILPLTGNRANIVWTDTPRAAAAAMALPDDAFAQELARRFGNFLGWVKPVAPRWSYPLSFQHAKTYTGDRLVLIGDAAHAIHPIAGQGFNMGLRDVAALADVLVTARAEGRDVGSELTLSAFEEWRKFDNTVLTHACDIFNRLFSNNIPPLQHARRLGLGLIDRLPPARHFFMREASGQTGTLPPLLRGEGFQ